METPEQQKAILKLILEKLEDNKTEIEQGKIMEGYTMTFNEKSTKVGVGVYSVYKPFLQITLLFGPDVSKQFNMEIDSSCWGKIWTYCKSIIEKEKQDKKDKAEAKFLEFIKSISQVNLSQGINIKVGNIYEFSNGMNELILTGESRQIINHILTDTPIYYGDKLIVDKGGKVPFFHANSKVNECRIVIDLRTSDTIRRGNFSPNLLNNTGILINNGPIYGITWGPCKFKALPIFENIQRLY